MPHGNLISIQECGLGKELFSSDSVVDVPVCSYGLTQIPDFDELEVVIDDFLEVERADGLDF